jgi:hypothetical protein
MPNNSSANNKYSISIYSLASTDPLAFVSSMFLFVIVGAPIVIFIYSMASGWQPNESWFEVFFWVAILTGAIFLFIHYRKRKLIKIINSGLKVSAKLKKFTAASQWVTLRLSYLWRGKMISRSIWLARSKLSAYLENKDELTLAIDPFNPRKVVILDLYHQ